jgi:hypothetical protein
MPNERSTFQQSQYLAARPFLQMQNPAGACSAFVAEWMVAGASLGASMFGSRTRSQGSADVRLARAMATERQAMFRDYGLVNTGELDAGDDYEAVLRFVSRPGLYYLKLHIRQGGANAGHAVGVSTDHGRYRLFDPNTGQESFDSDKDLEIGIMRLMMDYMRRYDVAGFEVTRLEMMMQAA